MEAIFTAVDTAGVATKVTAVVVGFIGIRLIFLGYKYASKLLQRG